MSTIAAIARDLKRSQARSLKNKQSTSALLQRYVNRAPAGRQPVEEPENVEEMEHVEEAEPEPEPEPVPAVRRVRNPRGRSVVQPPQASPPQSIQPQPQPQPQTTNRKEQARGQLQDLHLQWQHIQTSKAQLVIQERRLLKKMDQLRLEVEDVEDDDVDQLEYEPEPEPEPTPEPPTEPPVHLNIRRSRPQPVSTASTSSRVNGNPSGNSRPQPTPQKSSWLTSSW